MQWSDKGKCVEFGVELGRRLFGWLDYVSLLFISEIIVNNIAELLKVSGQVLSLSLSCTEKNKYGSSGLNSTEMKHGSRGL